MSDRRSHCIGSSILAWSRDDHQICHNHHPSSHDPPILFLLLTIVTIIHHHPIHHHHPHHCCLHPGCLTKHIKSGLPDLSAQAKNLTSWVITSNQVLHHPAFHLSLFPFNVPNVPYIVQRQSSQVTRKHYSPSEVWIGELCSTLSSQYELITASRASGRIEMWFADQNHLTTCTIRSKSLNQRPICLIIKQLVASVY